MPLMPPILTPVNDEGDNADCAADVCGLTVYIEDPGITQVVDIWGHPATVGELLAQHELFLQQAEWPWSVLGLSFYSSAVDYCVHYLEIIGSLVIPADENSEERGDRLAAVIPAVFR